MTAFQKWIEMPLTKRGESYAPANFAEKITPLDVRSHEGRRRLNYVTHFSLGMMWGAAYGIAALKGLRGQKAVNTVFGVVYTGDVLLNTALGLYHPTQWSKKDLIIDLVDKYVQATGHRRGVRPRAGPSDLTGSHIRPQARGASRSDHWRPEDLASEVSEPFTILPMTAVSSQLRGKARGILAA
jgi:hypothetical protein